mgnify:CR=1 FL=1
MSWIHEHYASLGLEPRTVSGVSWICEHYASCGLEPRTVSWTHDHVLGCVGYNIAFDYNTRGQEFESWQFVVVSFTIQNI